MKYLIQNKKEFVITIGVFLTFAVIAFWCVWDIVHDQFSTDNLIAIIGAIIEYFGWYFNMPTSEENCRHTGLMRLEKEIKKNGTDGEDFFDDPFHDESAGDKK